MGVSKPAVCISHEFPSIFTDRLRTTVRNKKACFCIREIEEIEESDKPLVY